MRDTCNLERKPNAFKEKNFFYIDERHFSLKVSSKTYASISLNVLDDDVDGRARMQMCQNDAIAQALYRVLEIFLMIRYQKSNQIKIEINSNKTEEEEGVVKIKRY